MKTKTDLIQKVVENTGVAKLDAGKVIDSFLREIVDCIKAEDVEISEFGIFSTKVELQKTIRNPQTGERSIIPAKIVVQFTPSHDMLFWDR